MRWLVWMEKREDRAGSGRQSEVEGKGCQISVRLLGLRGERKRRVGCKVPKCRKNEKTSSQCVAALCGHL